MLFTLLNLTKSPIPVALKDGPTSIPAKGRLEGIEAGQLGTADITRKKNSGLIKLVEEREKVEPQKPFKREMPDPPVTKKNGKRVKPKAEAKAEPKAEPKAEAKSETTPAAAEETKPSTTKSSKPSNGSRKKSGSSAE